MNEPPLLLHVFPSFAVGGAQVRLAAIANRFPGRWQHVVVPLDGRTDCTERVNAEVGLRCLPPPFPAGAGLAMRLWAISRLLRKLRPALLVTSNWGSMEWALANRLRGRRPHLHLEDGFGPEERSAQLPRRVRARRLILRGSQVVLPSETLLDLAVRRWKLPAAHCRLIPNGVDLQRLYPAAKAPGQVIGTTAALRPEKNLGRLLRAVALVQADLPGLRLDILGDGPERPALQALAARLGIADCTRFLGHVADPAALLRGMDVLALSSDTEQMPFAVLEAMASGLPVASTDVGDVRRMLAAENRRFVTPLSDAALAAALRALLQDPALRARLGQANRRRAEAVYDEEAMFQAHARLMDGLARP
ncbi:MAG: glycosyltransferase [Roseococcus sp.]|nr:glycosyltransferase [Roseococcus sp.]